MTRGADLKMEFCQTFYGFNFLNACGHCESIFIHTGNCNSCHKEQQNPPYPTHTRSGTHARTQTHAHAPALPRPASINRQTRAAPQPRSSVTPPPPRPLSFLYMHKVCGHRRSSHCGISPGTGFSSDQSHGFVHCGGVHTANRL